MRKMDEKLKYGLGGLITGGLIVWVVTSSIINSGNNGMMGMMGFRNSQNQVAIQNSNVFDAHFIEQMIPHHEDAITMSKLAQTKAQREEVKQLAENIIDSQSREINLMRTWYQDWFGKGVPENSEVMGQHGMMGNAGMHMGMMGDETDIETLQNSVDFDREFLQQMIPHHQMAVMMARMLKNGTQRT